MFLSPATCHTRVTRAGDAEELCVDHGGNPARRSIEDTFHDEVLFGLLCRAREHFRFV